MIPGDALLDAFINANILFIVAFSLWRIARLGLDRTGLKHAYTTQLMLLNTVFLAILFSPFLILGLTAVQNAILGQRINFTLSDMVVAYYLNGGFEMKASEFADMLVLRETFTADVMRAGSWSTLAVIVVFVVGVVVGIVRLVFSMFCLHKIVSASYGWRELGRVKIRLSDRTLVPFSTRGLWSYYVVIPTSMLTNPEDLKVSIAHEFQHLRQGDLEWEILLEMLKPFFFLNPAYHAWKRQIENLRELSCDQQVLISGKITAKSYCNTLLSVCQQTLRRDRTFVIAVPKVTLVTADRSALRDGKMTFLEHRITTLFDARKLRHPKLAFAVVILPLMAAVMLTAMAIQSPGDWSHDRLMLSTVVNLERLDEINRLSTFGRSR
ncbi:MAG: M56 family metallopeptidase [Tateyamaria sp.]|uniref:M56 family metallopeptidase n=1 Tax=Tateyamaria sp. TaxID=1929288 RepID=UPI00329F28D7